MGAAPVALSGSPAAFAVVNGTANWDDDGGMGPGPWLLSASVQQVRIPGLLLDLATYFGLSFLVYWSFARAWRRR